MKKLKEDKKYGQNTQQDDWKQSRNTVSKAVDYHAHNRGHCSLHTAAATLSLPLEQVKPKVCLHWPMHFSDGDKVLAVINDAFLLSCNTRKARGSRNLSSGFVETIELVHGEGCGTQVKHAAENGERRTLLVTRRRGVLLTDHRGLI